jgi:hypothetical protein
MTITVRAVRNAVAAGFMKLSGAPLKLRRAKLLAEAGAHGGRSRPRRAVGWGGPMGGEADFAQTSCECAQFARPTFAQISLCVG